MSRRLAALTLAVLPLLTAAQARAGEVAVVTDSGATHAVTVKGDVTAAATRIARRPGVKAAEPNAIAKLAWIPDDPGHADGQAGGWQKLQWNFLGTAQGVNAPGAWAVMRAIGRPGGPGVTVAVLDTGVAYRDYRGVRASPDFDAKLSPGYDFVAHNRYPVDRNGHGTHVASTIAESVNNGVGLTGLAYGATIMPIRVLNAEGEGNAVTIARGIRYAARHGADLINVSFVITPATESNARPILGPAIRYAQRRGVTIVAAAGNEGLSRPDYPANARGVIAVGATTEHGCLARYSNRGPEIDVVAPGGGPDARLPDDPNCLPDEPAGRDILQMTFSGTGTHRFGLPTGYEGTSMATPHVTAIAALLISSGLLGRHPAAKTLERRLESTALDLGPPGVDSRYGWGKVDAAHALLAPVTEDADTATSSGR